MGRDTPSLSPLLPEEKNDMGINYRI